MYEFNNSIRRDLIIHLTFFQRKSQKKFKMSNHVVPAVLIVKGNDIVDLELHNKPQPHFRIRDENGKSIGASCTQCYSCINKKNSVDLKVHNKPRPHFRIRDENGKSIGASCTQCYSCIKKRENAVLELQNKPRPHFRVRDENGKSCTQCHSCLNVDHQASGLEDGIYLTEPSITMPPSLITIAASVLYKNGQANLVTYAYQKEKESKIHKRKCSIGYSDFQKKDAKRKRAKVC